MYNNAILFMIHIQVSSNGPVSFGTGTSSTSPSFPTTPPLVAAFWRDINPATGGVIYYRVINSGSELATLGESLRAVPGGSCLQFTPASAVVITFERVSAFGGSSSVVSLTHFTHSQMSSLLTIRSTILSKWSS